MQKKSDDNKPTDNTEKLFPENLWATGYAETAAAAVSAPTPQQINYIGAKPTDSKAFNEQWKVVKKVMMKLDPGGERKIHFTFKPNRVIDRAHVDRYGCYRGLQYAALVVNHGVTGDSDNAFTTGVISTTAAKLVGIFDYEYCFRAINIFPRIQVAYNNIPTAAIGTGNLYTIADAAGTVVNNQTGLNHA